MPPERFAPDDPQEWLNRAMSDIAHAKARGLGVYLEDLCFNAQQAAEKALKALLLHQNVRFPYVHDIGELLRLNTQLKLATRAFSNLSRKKNISKP